MVKVKWQNLGEEFTVMRALSARICVHSNQRDLREGFRGTPRLDRKPSLCAGLPSERDSVCIKDSRPVGVLTSFRWNQSPLRGLIIRIQARRILPVASINKSNFSAIQPANLFRLPAPLINPRWAELKIAMPEEKNTIDKTMLPTNMNVSSMMLSIIAEPN
jgi:hypothetical protein